MKNLFLALAAAIILGVGIFALTRKSSQSPTTASGSSSSASTTNPSSSTGASSASNQSSGSTITYSDNGFTPSSLTVKSGTMVTIKNTSSRILQFDSDPHPQHTNNPELNVGFISPGQSQTFTVTRTGTFGYHNHLSADDRGTIVVN